MDRGERCATSRAFNGSSPTANLVSVIKKENGPVARDRPSPISKLLIPTNVKRPRNVDVPRAAAILYGDWGTSKAYVIGLAFAVGGYASFWLIVAMCVLTMLVGINYIIVCRLYPEGGGVYASVRHRSEVISIVGAFLLIADYLVTAAISSLSAFQYLGVPHPEKFAALAILVIGLLNLLGPKHTGGLAFLISVPTALAVITLAAFSVPHLGTAIGNVRPLVGGFWQRLERLRRDRARAFGCGSDCERDRRHAAQSGQHRGAPFGYQDFHPGAALGDGRSLLFHRAPRFGDACFARSAGG